MRIVPAIPNFSPSILMTKPKYDPEYLNSGSFYVLTVIYSQRYSPPSAKSVTEVPSAYPQNLRGIGIPYFAYKRNCCTVNFLILNQIILCALPPKYSLYANKGHGISHVLCLYTASK